MPLETVENGAADDIKARPIGEEARKSYATRLSSGFIKAYLSGPAILDIGYKGYLDDVVPIVPQAIGVDLDYPGYDGRILPFPDESQDAVFSSHTLEHIADFRGSLRDWFRVLKIGGFLIIMVPHQYLYEKRLSLPSRWNADHKRFYTPASLLMEIENALEPNTYRLRHLADNDAGFDYSISPERHSGGCYEVELVLEKIKAPAWQLASPNAGLVGKLAPVKQVRAPVAEALLPQAIVPGRGEIAPGLIDAGGMLIRDFAPAGKHTGRICALKLDHYGDFVMSLPALEALRRSFPRHHIRLICGSWNVAAAQASRLVDEVRSYDYFPEHSGAWDGRPVQGAEVFAAAAAGSFDIAIDLRVDEDTRHLLANVDATLRCGIGSRKRFPFLDVSLPLGHHGRANPIESRPPDSQLEPGQFKSRMRRRERVGSHTVAYSTGFFGHRGHIIYGPYMRLPIGRWRVTFGVCARRFLPLRSARLTVDVVRDCEILAEKTVRRFEIGSLGSEPLSLDFDNYDPEGEYEFRVDIGGRALGSIWFTGVRLKFLEMPELPRFRPVEVHIGEQIGLLVDLVRQRATDIYARLRASMDTETAGSSARNAASGDRCIVIAPFSNSTVRDWPLDNYVELVRLLLNKLDCRIVLVGSRQQTAMASHILQRNGGDSRIINLVGKTAWTEVPALLRAANLVICNNSGIAHQAAALGVPTLALYSGSHQPQEWGPRGPVSRAIMAPVPCSPCGYERIEECSAHHLCMRLISSDYVLEQAISMLQPREQLAATAG